MNILPHYAKFEDALLHVQIAEESHRNKEISEGDLVGVIQLDLERQEWTMRDRDDKE